MSSNLKVNNILPSTGTTVAVSGIASVTGQVTSTDHISITADSKRFLAGASNDARMYHDGSHTYFDSLTGHLYLYNHASSQQIIFGTEGTNKWKIMDSGHFIPHTDSTFDIGTSTVRVRNIYADNLYGSGANLTNLPVPTTITVSDESTDTSCNVLFTTTTSGNLAPKTGTNLVFNSASGNLRTGSLFVGTGTNESKTQDGLIMERNSGDGEIHITAGRSGGNYGGMSFFVAGANGVTKRHTMIYDGSFRWYDNNSNETVRIGSDGDLLIGTSQPGSSVGVGLKLNYHATNPTFNCVINQATGNHSFYHLYNTNGTHNAYRFYVMVNGGIANHSGNNTNLSDERMKKNITNMGSVYDTFKKFKFKDFNYIDDEASESKKHGLIAQDVETIDSDLITNDFKIAPDSEGNDVYRKALKEEQFMMIGMKALQEAIAKIEILEAKIAALEGS